MGRDLIGSTIQLLVHLFVLDSFSPPTCKPNTATVNSILTLDEYKRGTKKPQRTPSLIIALVVWPSLSATKALTATNNTAIVLCQTENEAGARFPINTEENLSVRIHRRQIPSEAQINFAPTNQVSGVDIAALEWLPKT